MKYFDLHTHSTYSDGVYTPKKLLDLAKAEGLSGISITDHDSVFGLQEAIKHAKEIEMEFIPGVEIQGFGLEILGYFIDHKSPELCSLLEANQKTKLEHLKRRIEGLADLNVDVDMEEVEEHAKKMHYHQVMAPHLAEVLINKGYGTSTQEIYNKYFKKIRVRLDTEPIKAKKIIETIKIAGGVAILPHPWLLRHDQKEGIENLIVKLSKHGLCGVETRGPIPQELKEESHEFMQIIRDVCKDLDLIETAGSDFHGTSMHKENILGKYKASEEIVKELERRRE